MVDRETQGEVTGIEDAAKPAAKGNAAQARGVISLFFVPVPLPGVRSIDFERQ